MNYINSINNRQIKLIKGLESKKHRRESSLYIAEGYNLLKDAPKEQIQSIFVRESDQEKYQSITNQCDSVFIVSDEIFNKVAFTENSNGLLAVMKKQLEREVSGDIILVLDRISDPGNLGTIIRTAVAMGVFDLVLMECTDPYAPKVIRSSMGGNFYSNIVECKMVDFAKITQSYQVFALDMKGLSVYDFVAPCKLALVVGNEAHGISADIKDKLDGYLSIPMCFDRIDSLNAAVACSIAISTIVNKCK